MKPYSWAPVAVDISVRPLFRVLGAVFLGACASIFIHQAVKLLDATTVRPEICDRGKLVGRLLCTVSNWTLEVMPKSLQGPLSALAGAAVALVLIALAWILLRPLVSAAAKRFSKP